MVEEVTVAVGSAGMVVLPAGLANADWKREERGRLVSWEVRVASSGNVMRFSSLKSVAQASSILLMSEDGYVVLVKAFSDEMWETKCIPWAGSWRLGWPRYVFPDDRRR